MHLNNVQTKTTFLNWNISCRFFFPWCKTFYTKVGFIQCTGSLTCQWDSYSCLRFCTSCGLLRKAKFDETSQPIDGWTFHFIYLFWRKMVKGLFLLPQFCTKCLLQENGYLVNWNSTANSVNTFMMSLITGRHIISIQKCWVRKPLK